MKVKTWIRKGFSVPYIEDENAKKLLLDNGFSYLTEYKEEILDIPEEEIIDNDGYPHSGFWYNNTLYDLVHEKSKFRSELDDLEYGIIEEGYPEEIPYCTVDIYEIEDFKNWMLEEGKKCLSEEVDD